MRQRKPLNTVSPHKYLPLQITCPHAPPKFCVLCQIIVQSHKANPVYFPPKQNVLYSSQFNYTLSLHFLEQLSKTMFILISSLHCRYRILVPNRSIYSPMSLISLNDFNFSTNKLQPFPKLLLPITYSHQISVYNHSGKLLNV